MKTKTQPRYRHQGNYVAPLAEENHEASMTVPDMSISLQDLLTRHTISHDIVPVYNPDWTLPDPRSLDLTEIDELKRENRQAAKDVLANHRTRAKKKETPVPDPPGDVPEESPEEE